MPILISRGLFCGQLAILACNCNCTKAWGRNNRPRVQVSDNEDDYAYLADGELGEAPADPGTYEGDHAKPRDPSERHNKWCWRECERPELTAQSARSRLEPRG